MFQKMQVYGMGFLWETVEFHQFWEKYFGCLRNRSLGRNVLPYFSHSKGLHDQIARC